MNSTPLSALLDLRAQVALVTGAGRGIGQGIAMRLAEAGASVIAADIDEAAARSTVAAIAIANGGGTADSVRIDASRPDDARRAVESAVERFGGIDMLVNNAAIFPATPIMDITEAQWDSVLDLNLKGTFFLAQSAARRMIGQGRGGRIVNIASMAWYLPPGMLGHYDASKGGVVSVTRSLAKELGVHGIRVNAVAPGIVPTPGSKQSSAAIAESLGLDLGELPVRSVLGRHGTADDIARAVYFLVSGLSDYITGSVVEVGGGYQLY